jgi:hypothetical protein
LSRPLPPEIESLPSAAHDRVAPARAGHRRAALLDDDLVVRPAGVDQNGSSPTGGVVGRSCVSPFDGTAVAKAGLLRTRITSSPPVPLIVLWPAARTVRTADLEVGDKTLFDSLDPASGCRWKIQAVTPT